MERLKVGAAHDRVGIVHLAFYVCGSNEETEAYIEWLRQRVLNLVGRDDGPGNDRYWRLVYALADAAQAAGSLSWRQARLVLQRSERRWFDRQFTLARVRDLTAPDDRAGD